MSRAVLKEVSIGDVVVKASTWNPVRDAADDEISYIDLSAIDNVTKAVNGVQSLAGRDAPSRARQLVRAGDILVSTVRPNLNGVARVPDELDGGTASTGFCVLRPQSGKIDPSFLFHWVQSSSFVDEMVRKATGASYPAVSDKIIFQSAIPLPPLDEQKRIAAILDQADELRRKRKRAIDRLNQLGQAIFHEMFGDIRAASKRFETRTFDDIADVRLGKMLDKSKSKGGTMRPYLRNANVRWFDFDLTDILEMEFLDHELDRFALKDGDLLICEGGEPGRCAVWRGEERTIYYQKALHRARVNTDIVLPEYVANWFYIAAQSGMLADSVTSATIAHLTGEKIKKLEIFLPPIVKQREFVERLRALDALLESQRSAEATTASMFQALQHRAFRGELGEAL